MLLRLDGDGPRYAQITRALSAAIQDGALPPGARLPSTRELAADLGCARNVVLLAYEQLLLEGYLSARSGGGTYVSPDLAIERRARPAPAGAARAPALSASGQRIHAAAMRARRVLPPLSGLPVDFMFGICEPDARTVVAIRTSFAAALRGRTFGYGAAIGDEGLRHALAERLRGARGILRDAGRIVVTSGAQQAVDVCARLLLDPGDRVAMEDPGYASARAVFEAAGAVVLPVPIDRNGLDVAVLAAERRPVRLVYVTPSHQFPTGAVLSVARRHALVDWARRRGAYILEDDYDGEFRYTGRRIEALAAMQPDGPVIYCGTFAKALFPGLRLGFLSLPAELAVPVRHAKWLTDCTSSPLLQKTIAAMMATGEYERHIRRMTRRYRARRDALLAALRRHLGDEAIVEGSGGGLHVVAWLPNLPKPAIGALIDRCAARGVGVYSVAPHATSTRLDAGLLLGYGIVEPPAIAAGVKIVGEAYRALIRESGRRRRSPSRRRP